MSCVRLGSASASASPGVGRNLQDHIGVDHLYRSRRRTLNDDLSSLVGQALGRGAVPGLARRSARPQREPGRRFHVHRDSSRGRPEHPALLLSGEFPQSTAEDQAAALARPLLRAFSLAPSPAGRPVAATSRSRPTIRRSAPMIVPNYFSTDHDVAEMLEASRFLRRLSATPTLCGPYRRRAPARSRARATTTPSSLISRQRSGTVYHPVGTCAMGPKLQLVPW